MRHSFELPRPELRAMLRILAFFWEFRETHGPNLFDYVPFLVGHVNRHSSEETQRETLS